MRNRDHPVSRWFFSVGAVVLLAGCSGQAWPTDDTARGSDFEVTIERTAGSSWSVGVKDPRFTKDEECDSDPAVESAVISADLPSSAYGITLKSGSTENDALRIAICLDAALESGVVSVSGPRAD